MAQAPGREAVAPSCARRSGFANRSGLERPGATSPAARRHSQACSFQGVLHGGKGVKGRSVSAPKTRRKPVAEGRSSVGAGGGSILPAWQLQPPAGVAKIHVQFFGIALAQSRGPACCGHGVVHLCSSFVACVANGLSSRALVALPAPLLRSRSQQLFWPRPLLR